MKCTNCQRGFSEIQDAGWENKKGRYETSIIDLNQVKQPVAITDRPSTIVTHDGRFHGDEVLACALLKIHDRDLKIVRTREK